MTRSLFSRESRAALEAAVAPRGKRPEERAGAAGKRRGGSAARGAARRPALLLAFDFDGTLAPIVRRPGDVRLPAETRRLLARAGRLPGVRLAVVSARPMADLARHAPVPRLLRLAQYGLEGFAAPPPSRARRFKAGAARLRALLEPLAARFPGALVEDKRLTVAIHERGLSEARRAALRRALRPVADRARRLGFGIERGRRITDFVPAGWDKGRALREARRRARPATTFYFGDSDGDEAAFASLGAGDFGVRVGRGPTSAAYRVRGPRDVARFLQTLLALRA